MPKQERPSGTKSFIMAMKNDRDIHITAGQDALARYHETPMSDIPTREHLEQVVLEQERRIVAGYEQVLHLLDQSVEAVVNSYDRSYLIFQGTRYVLM